MPARPDPDLAHAHDPLSGLPPPAQARVVGAYAKTAIDTARELGADMTRLALACGLPEIARPGTPLPEAIAVQRYIELLNAAAEQLGDPFFGLHVGQRMGLSTFASYGLVLCTCADFRSAAEQTRRFEGLAHDLGRSQIVEREGVAHYRWHSPWLAQPGARHLSESVMAGIHTFVSWLAGGAQVSAYELAFVHAAPEGVDLTEYRLVFGAPVRFGAAVTEASFPAALLDAPLPNADIGMFPPLARAAEERLLQRQREAGQAGARAEAAIVQAVRERIRTQLMHDSAQLPAVAAALGLSARTLQRRLAEVEASFTALVEAVRREQVQQYLRDPSLSLTEIAFLLGFSEQSNFNHAFRAWFGCTPAAWRLRPEP
ncbi:AraC family transcriptional regulator [Roseateles oligotrophus]|uniref:AraC family transcriptional regulator n=1 Tax=Roseateles oligotrophus TaxID=1769250 RepID=A0ABT2YHH4_9BURK|nr:AraC family transcriptional regulator [Roseateles oligotrophus]MCV2369478.1 AraC family transcriptional regulator [Roseateles oligotrophus]